MERIGVNSENVGKNPYPSIRWQLRATRKWDSLSFVLKVQAEVSILFEILSSVSRITCQKNKM